jgi:threonine synthase
MTYAGVLAQYGHLLDLPAHTRPVTLLEGDTPLIPATNLAREFREAGPWPGGGFELFVKFEGLNPTGSFKDRGMTAAVSEALGRGAKTVICASTGNTAASAAAYAARAGMQSIVSSRGHGAGNQGRRLVRVSRLALLRRRRARWCGVIFTICLVNRSTLPIEGEDRRLPDLRCPPPRLVCLPVGNAGNITAHWAGFSQYDGLKSAGLPRILGVQAAGAAPLVLGHPVEHPETVATAIRIGARRATGPRPRRVARTDHRRQ